MFIKHEIITNVLAWLKNYFKCPQSNKKANYRLIKSTSKISGITFVFKYLISGPLKMSTKSAIPVSGL